MKINDAIKSQIGKTEPQKQTGLHGMYIEQKLNNLFHADNRLEETRAGLHASSIICSDNELCYREMVLSLYFKHNAGHQHPTGLLKIFAAGNSIHAKWQGMFEKDGLSVGIEDRSFSELYELYYTPDAKILLDNCRKYVCEIKSVNTFQFQKMTSHPSGSKQLHVYMHMEGIPHGFVLCEDKNTQATKVFYVEYDYKIVLPYLKRLNEIQELKRIFEKKGALPAFKCQNCNTKRAEGCNMKDACFEIGKGRIRNEV